MCDNAGRDCEYGNYRDMNNEVEWYDDFFPNKKECASAYAEYKMRWYEAVEEIAECMFGFNTDNWEKEDYEIFCEKVGLY